MRRYQRTWVREKGGWGNAWRLRLRNSRRIGMAGGLEAVKWEKYSEDKAGREVVMFPNADYIPLLRLTGDRLHTFSLC